MIDFSGYLPFSLEPFAARMTPGPYQADQLILACQLQHLGFVDGRPSSAGAKALAHWLVEHRDFIDRPKSGTHPLNCGTTIERILAGDLLPEEDFAIDLAEMSEGAILPAMFGLTPADPVLQESSVPGFPLSPGMDVEAPEPARLSLAPVPSSPLPPLGALGGALPPGRLFHPIADTRFPQGFVLTGCGMMLCLDESTAKAMRDALSVGIDHLRAARTGERRAA